MCSSCGPLELRTSTFLPLACRFATAARVRGDSAFLGHAHAQSCALTPPLSGRQYAVKVMRKDNPALVPLLNGHVVTKLYVSRQGLGRGGGGACKL